MAPTHRAAAAALASLLAFAGAPAANASTPTRPAARLTVDAAMITVGATVRADPRTTRLPPARGPRTTIALSFGDHTRPVRLHRLAVRTHRYRKAGRYTITLTVRAARRTSRARRTITVGKRTVRATPAAHTRVASDGDIASLTGDPATGQTVVLRAGAPAPTRGEILVVPADRQHPDGLLGRVTHAARQPDGSTRLTIIPAALDDAYRSVTLHTEGTLGDSGLLITDASGRVLRGAPRAASPKASLHISASQLRCTGGINGPLDVDLDLTPLRWQLDFDLHNPFIHFLVAGNPKLSAALGLAAKGECRTNLAVRIVIPIAGTPLVIRLSPRLELSADGGLSAKFTWTPRLAFGFDRGNGINQTLYTFKLGTVKPEVHADAKAELFFGPDTELTLGGRVGVSAAFGPVFDVKLDQTLAQSCVHGDVAMKIKADANADVFIKHWSFALLSVTVHSWPLFDACTNHPADTGTNTGGGGGGTDGGGGGGQQPLPPGALSVAHFAEPPGAGEPWDITNGPDGNLWFSAIKQHTDQSSGLGRITPAGQITMFPLPDDDVPYGIVTGPDGNLWFAGGYGYGHPIIGRMTPAGSLTTFTIPNHGDLQEGPGSIVVGPDHNLWFTYADWSSPAGSIGRITTDGTITLFPLTAGQPMDIAAGPDGNLWVAQWPPAEIDKISPQGALTEYPVPPWQKIVSSQELIPEYITAGPDGNLWFSMGDAPTVNRITPAGDFAGFPFVVPVYGQREPGAITVGRDGDLWAPVFWHNLVRTTTSGQITTYEVPADPGLSIFQGIVTGPDGNLWLCESGVFSIARVMPPQ